jgi:hypothetical protein
MLNSDVMDADRSVTDDGGTYLCKYIKSAFVMARYSCRSSTTRGQQLGRFPTLSECPLPIIFPLPTLAVGGSSVVTLLPASICKFKALSAAISTSY